MHSEEGTAVRVCLAAQVARRQHAEEEAFPPPVFHRRVK